MPHKSSAVIAHSANLTSTWPRRSCPHRLPSTPSGNSTEVTRSMRRFFLLPVLMGGKAFGYLLSAIGSQQDILADSRQRIAESPSALFLRSFFVTANNFLNQPMPNDVVARQHDVGKAFDISQPADCVGQAIFCVRWQIDLRRVARDDDF